MATAPTTSGSSSVSGSGGTDTTGGASSTTGGAASTTGGAAAASQPTAPAPDPAAVAAAKAAQAAGSIGAQVILDFNGDGSLGARGGASAIMEENVAAYAAHMVELGLDPAAPSGPPVPPEVLKAKQDAADAIAAAQAAVAAAHATAGQGAATRVSSLAAGIITEPGDIPTPPSSLSGAAA